VAEQPSEPPQAPPDPPTERVTCPPWYRFLGPQSVFGAHVSVIAFGWLFSSFCSLEAGEPVRLPRALILLYGYFGKWPPSLALMVAVFAGIAAEMRSARQKWLTEHGQK
jgi:hypothetical protein